MNTFAGGGPVTSCGGSHSPVDAGRKFKVRVAELVMSSVVGAAGGKVKH